MHIQIRVGRRPEVSVEYVHQLFSQTPDKFRGVDYEESCYDYECAAINEESLSIVNGDVDLVELIPGVDASRIHYITIAINKPYNSTTGTIIASDETPFHINYYRHSTDETDGQFINYLLEQQMEFHIGSNSDNMNIAVCSAYQGSDADVKLSLSGRELVGSNSRIAKAEFNKLLPPTVVRYAHTNNWIIPDRITW